MKNFIAAALFALTLTACGDGVNKAPNGEACESNGDCESADCRQELTGCHFFFGCSTYELAGGMCTSVCTWLDEGTSEELLQSDCADGEQCLSPNGDADATVCFVGCEVQEDCREDYVCTELGGFSTCLPPEDVARIIEVERISASPIVSILE